MLVVSVEAAVKARVQSLERMPGDMTIEEEAATTIVVRQTNARLNRSLPIYAERPDWNDSSPYVRVLVLWCAAAGPEGGRGRGCAA